MLKITGSSSLTNPLYIWHKKETERKKKKKKKEEKKKEKRMTI